MCLYCQNHYGNIKDLTQHVEFQHNNVTEEDIRKAIVRHRKYQAIKVNMIDFVCKVCNKDMCNFEDLKHHLIGKHKKPIDLAKYGVWLHNIVNDDQYNCVLCGLNLNEYRLLNKHVINHYTKNNKGKDDENAVDVPVNANIRKTYSSDREKNNTSRTSAIAIIHSTNVCPFRFNGSFMCLYCSSQYHTMPELTQHVELVHKLMTVGDIRKALVRLRKYQSIKVHVEDFGCKLCDEEISNYEDLKHHLIGKHEKPVDFANDGVCPYKITKDGFSCVLCGLKFEDYFLLNKHMIIDHVKLKNNKGETRVSAAKVKVVRVRKKAVKVNNDMDVRELELKKNSRESAIAIIHGANVCPFKYNRFYMCLYCPSRYVDMTELVQHVELQHKNSTVSEIRKAIINIHCYKPVKVNVLDFGCKFCDDEMINFEDLKHHLIDKHEKPIDLTNDGVWPYKITENEFMCLLCDKKFVHFWPLNRHLNEHYTKYICDQCGTGFASDLRLRSHVATHVVGSYPCDECGKLFNTAMLKQQHIERVHKKIKKHRCIYCMETFLEYNHKQKHIKIAHGVKMRNYKCSFCPKVFNSTSGVRSHERCTHIKLQSFKCDFCDYTCAIKTMLTDHMVCHTNKKNFECQICKKMYPRKKSLTEHMKIHNNDRRFICQHCDRAFVQKCSLKGHMKTHHKEFLI